MVSAVLWSCCKESKYFNGLLTSQKKGHRINKTWFTLTSLARAALDSTPVK